jgi:hypothetical protein
MYDDDIEFDDESCPKCGAQCYARRCSEIGCDDGWIDRYDEDPLWYSPGEEERCDTCVGTGWERWCPKCGYDLQRKEYINGEPSNSTYTQEFEEFSDADPGL